MLPQITVIMKFKHFSICLFLCIVGISSLSGQFQMNPWGGSPQSIPSSGGDVTGIFSPPICNIFNGWAAISAQNGLNTLSTTYTPAYVNIPGTTVWQSDILWQGPVGYPSNYTWRFNKIGWSFVSQSYQNPWPQDCDIRVHPVYIYPSSWATSNPNFSDFNLTGGLCGSPNSFVRIEMAHSNQLYEYNIEVVEVNTSNQIVLGGLNWNSGWKKNADKYFNQGLFLSPEYNNDFKLAKSSGAPVLGSNTFYGINFQQGKRYMVRFNHRFPWSSNVATTTKYFNAEWRAVVNNVDINLPTVASMKIACNNSPISISVNTVSTFECNANSLVATLSRTSGYCGANIGGSSFQITINSPQANAVFDLRNYLNIQQELNNWPVGVTYKDYRLSVKAFNSLGSANTVTACFRLQLPDNNFKLTRSAVLENLLGVPNTGVADRSEDFNNPVIVGANSVGINIQSNNFAGITAYKVDVNGFFNWSGWSPMGQQFTSGWINTSGSLPSSYLLNNIDDDNNPLTPPLFFRVVTENQALVPFLRYQVVLTVRSSCGEESKMSYFRFSQNAWSKVVNTEGDFIEPMMERQSSKVEEIVDVNLFPSPFNDALNISGLESFSNVKILNIRGEVVYNSKDALQDSYVINTADWPSGMYILHAISHDKSVLTKKVLKLVN
jgi:hypothetical protein